MPNFLPIDSRFHRPGELALEAYHHTSTTLWVAERKRNGANRPAQYRFDSPLRQASLDAVTGITLPEFGSKESSDDEKARDRFFRHWRWAHSECSRRDSRLGYLPADLRLPDHTVWSHMQVSSALQGCWNESTKALEPAFLKLRLGPVQDFVAAARSVRDLWSGSYLVSWLMAAGLRALSERVGPDAVLSPYLKGLPLFDLHWCRQTMHRDLRSTAPFEWSDADLLVPSLPNVFLALVPKVKGVELAKSVEEAIRSEWEQIGNAVWRFCDQGGLTANERGVGERRDRFKRQIDQFLSISWQVTPWATCFGEIKELGKRFDESMSVWKAVDRSEAVREMVEALHSEDRDLQFRGDSSKATLQSAALIGSVGIALNSWQLDGVRQNTAFPAANMGGWEADRAHEKDSLTGQLEAVAGGKEWVQRVTERQSRGDFWGSLFRHNDWLSAPTLVKRLWHVAYLAQSPWNLRVESKHFPMPNTRGVAAHDPEAKEEASSEDYAEVSDLPMDEKYFAVLSFDGDTIGQWVCGEHNPEFETQLADDDESGDSIKSYFEDHGMDWFLHTQRPLTPSSSLQFSEAFGQFSARCARRIVMAFDGRLVYSGGDDLLALLPADTALACGRALVRAFKGKTVEGPSGTVLFESVAQGFLADPELRDARGQLIPFIVPGPAVTASVGIAIAHFKAPLQDVVRHAKVAEQRAKNDVGRNAVAVTLLKRSGEQVEWGCHWDSGGVEAHEALLRAIQAGHFSKRFPHRGVQLLAPYLSERHANLGGLDDAPGFRAVLTELIEKELASVVMRQEKSTGSEEQRQAVFECLSRFLTNLAERTQQVGVQGTLRAVIGLLDAVAFAVRTCPDGQLPAEGRV